MVNRRKRNCKVYVKFIKVTSDQHLIHHGSEFNYQDVQASISPPVPESPAPSSSDDKRKVMSR